MSIIHFVVRLNYDLSESRLLGMNLAQTQNFYFKDFLYQIHLTATVRCWHLAEGQQRANNGLKHV